MRPDRKRCWTRIFLRPFPTHGIDGRQSVKVMQLVRSSVICLGCGKHWLVCLRCVISWCIIRAAYAKQILAAAGIVDNARLEAALSATRREDFLGAGPWFIRRGVLEDVTTRIPFICTPMFSSALCPSDASTMADRRCMRTSFTVRRRLSASTSCISEPALAIRARSLNIELQAALNPATDRKVERFGWTFAPR